MAKKDPTQASRMTIWCLGVLILVIAALALGVGLFYASGHGKAPLRKGTDPTSSPAGLHRPDALPSESAGSLSV